MKISRDERPAEANPETGPVDPQTPGEGPLSFARFQSSPLHFLFAELRRAEINRREQERLSAMGRVADAD